jgi:hypothetical protein
VKRVTGWANPVDNITSFAEVVCDNYEALVDEKRKRTADEDGVSKQANTRSGRRAEQVQPTARREVGETSANPSGTTQPWRMEVDDFAKKGKERVAPTYRLKSDIEQATDLRKVLEEKILDSHQPYLERTARNREKRIPRHDRGPD